MTVQKFYPIIQEVAAIQVNTVEDIHAVAPEVWVRTSYNEDGTVDEFCLVIKGTGGLVEGRVKPGQWLLAFNSGGVSVFRDEEHLLKMYRRCSE